MAIQACWDIWQTNQKASCKLKSLENFYGAAIWLHNAAWSLDGVLVPKQEHSDAAAHDVELAALVSDEWQRVLGAVGDAVAVQGVNAPSRPPFAGRVLPGVALIARCRLSTVTLTHLAPTPDSRKKKQNETHNQEEQKKSQNFKTVNTHKSFIT